MKKLYFVKTGVDSRHLFDVQIFEKLKDARAAYEKCEGAKELHSLDFPHKFEPGCNKKVIVEFLK